MLINNPVITGSFTVNGTNFITNTPTTGSNTFNGNQIISGSAIVTGSLQVTGSMTATGTITAQTLVVSTISSSIEYASGSNIFGSSLSNRQQMTGSVTVTGSMTISGSTVVNVNTSTTPLTIAGGGNSGVPLMRINNGLVSQSFVFDDNSNLIVGPSSFATRLASNTYSLVVTGSVGIGTASPAYTLDVSGSGRFVSSLTAGGNITSTGGSFYLPITAGGNFQMYASGNNYAIYSSLYGNMLTIDKTTAAATFANTLTATNFAAGSATATYPFNSTSAAGTQALLNSTRTGGGGIIIQNSGSDRCYIGTANWVGLTGFDTTTSDLAIANAQNSSIVFAINAANVSTGEKMRINSNGNVGIGTTSSVYRLGVYQTSAQGATVPAFRVSYVGGGDGNSQNVAQFTNDATLATSAYLYIGAYSGADWYIGKNVAGNAGSYRFEFGTATSNILAYLTTAGVWSTTGGGTSDRRTKKDIQTITDNALPFINELKPVSFKFKDDPAQKTRRGFIAQEVLETSIPDLVLGDGDQEDGTYGLDYDGILALAIKAIQEQQAQIEALKTEIEILKNK